jgi:hypothetical protein
MVYKIVEMQTRASNYDYNKEDFIKSFQNKVNEFLDNGYVPTGGICISKLNPPSGDVHFVQALIKE